MKYLKELVMRFPLLIAALILALLGVYKDYSSQDESLQINDVQVMENMRPTENVPFIKNVRFNDSYGGGSYNAESKKDLVNKNSIGRKFDGNSVKIIKVIDGDSLRIRINNSVPLDVRLYGIDAPEYKQKYGKKAHAFLYNSIQNNAVKNLEIINVDRYDRLVAVLYFNHGISVQEELLKNGMAWYYGRFCKMDALCLDYKKWAKDAKKARVGLWADASPKAPWNWKKKR